MILEPFWEFRNRLWKDIFLNMLLFLPLGVLIGNKKGIAVGALLSALIEISQFLLGRGFCEVDDVLNNTIGTGIGVMLWIGVSGTVLKKWDDLPEFMKTPEVRPYWEILNKKRGQLLFKRLFDFIVALILFAVLAIPMLVIAVMIKQDSPGTIFYRQERVTLYGKRFKIHKFRTMVSNADKIGSGVTVSGDSRITKVGAKLRNLRLDELPQLIDILEGNMSFVGTRPESVKYVKQYKAEYNATLLMPAGVTSEASIRYKDEAALLDAADDVDHVYVEQVLPDKMKWNLYSIQSFSFFQDVRTMFRTVFAVLGKNYE